MNDKPPVIECAHCGQDAYLAKDGAIACYCTPALSAAEHHTLDRINDDFARDLKHALYGPQETT